MASHVPPPARGRSGRSQMLCCGLRAPDAPGNRGAKGKAKPIRSQGLSMVVLGGVRSLVLKEHSPELLASAITAWE